MRHISEFQTYVADTLDQFLQNTECMDQKGGMDLITVQYVVLEFVASFSWAYENYLLDLW